MSPWPNPRPGFTLIELLVVVLVIGILAAIALPRFLGQRTRSKNAAAQAAVRHALLAARSYYTQNSESYSGLGSSELKGYESSLSGTEAADGQQPGTSGANPQDIWIGNGSNGSNPATGDAGNGKTVVLCSVSRGDTVYCVRDVDGTTSYLYTANSSLSVGSAGTSGSGWNSSWSGGGASGPTAGSATIYASAGDGEVRGGSNTSWAAATSTATGSSNTGTGAGGYGAYSAQSVGDLYTYMIVRSFLPFDLSSLPSNATITSAALVVNAAGVYNGSGGWGAAGGAVGVTPSTQSSMTSLANSDFGNVGATDYVTRINFASLTTGANNFTVNAAGLSAIQTAIGGNLKLVMRTSFDIDNSAPASTKLSGVVISYSEQTGTSQDPYLQINYTTP